MLEAIVLRAMNKEPEHRPSSFDMIQSLSNIEANLSIEQLDDPDATKILPRVKTADLTPRRNIRENAVKIIESKPKVKPAEKIFLRSKAFIFGLILVLIAGFGAGFIMAFGQVAESEIVAVPDVAGKQLGLARQLLEDGRLRVSVAEIYDASVPAGQVVAQDPIAGRNVKAERLVTIYVSKGGETISMPDLIGLKKNNAIDRIKKLGLQLGAVYEKDSELEPGTILSHDPIIGTKINRGQVIDLVVSHGSAVSIAPRYNRAEAASAPKTMVIERTYVPDVQNVMLDVAKSSVEQRGLSVGTVTYRESAQNDGTILSQNPLPAAYVELGTPIDFVVSRSAGFYDNPEIENIYADSEVVEAPFEQSFEIPETEDR